MGWILAVGVGLLLLGLVAWYRSAGLHESSGLPYGRVIYSDTIPDLWLPQDRPLYSPEHRLTGKPDYIVQTLEGLIPVEVKSSTAPEIPYWGHVLQVAAYCLLIEEEMGQTPPYGLLKYADALFEIDYTDELRDELLDTMDIMREGYAAGYVKRSHHEAARCAACGFRTQCDESLVR